MAKISMIVNGNPVNANVDPRTLLVQFLRENLRLTGTHVAATPRSAAPASCIWTARR
ncbi:aerobic-type carbon monoxide dehydrogenase small subunit (CoxS/CutS family) [Bradyrhizobium elkanii]